MKFLPEGDLYLPLRYRIVKNIIDFDQRQYVNLDPPGDRPTYDKLQINDPYLGYKGIVYTPIDLPKLEIDKKQIKDLLTSKTLLKEYPNTIFDCEHGAGKVLFLKHNNYREPEIDSEWFAWVDKELPNVKKFITNLPYKSIRQLSFVAPPAATSAHYDEPLNATPYLRKQSPSCYRIRWSDVTNFEKEIFFLSKDSEATKIYPVLPIETNTFVYDGSVYEHGADKGFPISDRCQIIISGILDIEKHHTLLDKSIKKYADYVLYDKLFMALAEN